MFDINWKIGGVGGMGAMGVGAMFSKVMLRSGFYVTDYNEYNSIIKGGHNNYQVRASNKKVYVVSKNIDILLALDEFSLSLVSTLSQDSSFVICDWAMVKDKTIISQDRVIDIPLSMLNKQNGGDEIMKNIIGLGASLALINADINLCKDLIADQFNKKGEDIVNKNITLLQCGYDYVLENHKIQVEEFTKIHGVFSKQSELSENLLATGNDAIAIAAVAEGVGYYAAYPMTPASSILHYLASIADKYNIVVKHAEDEIAALNSAIGASFGGARAMVGTSGGGFSLMVEALGLAAITETPIVIAMISRPGPSTGMPTWTDQADLRFMMHASQGEFIRLLFTPGDPIECFELTKLAFVLAEKYQIPAIILSDKYLAESKWSCQIDSNTLADKRYSLISQSALDRIGNYERYADTFSGVTPRSIPGMKNGEHLANSDEHNNYGLTDESAEMRMIQMNKRIFKKLQRLKSELPTPKIYGLAESKIGIISFGSIKNQILETLKYVNNIKFLSLDIILPFPEEYVEEFIKSVDKFIVVENNISGQLAGVIREYTGQKADSIFLKDDGRPIFYEDLIQYLKENGYQ
jgi:2-oxoglutarate ferredoxin oxidoreductase subunit alpha